MECRGVGRRWTVIRLSSQLRRSLHYEYPSTIPESIPVARGSDVAIHRLLIRLLKKLLLMTAIHFLPCPLLRKVYRRDIGINTSTTYSEFLEQMSDCNFFKDSYTCRINFFFKLVGWDFGYCGHYWPVPDDRWWWLWRNWWNEDWQGKPKYSEKTYLSATLSATNPTWLDPGVNPGRRGGKPATNRLSYGAALSLQKLLVPNFCHNWETISFWRRCILCADDY
jgi:hypothetical protein